MRRGYSQIRYLAILFLIICAVFMNTEIKTFAASTPILSKTKLQLEVGSDKKLTVKNAKKAKIKWSSSNKKVVTVTQDGKIKAKKAGTATIKCVVKIKSKKKTLSCDVTVVPSSKKIKITVGNEVLTATMENNKLAKNMMAQMPFTITLRDLAGEEKYGYTPKELNTEGVNGGYDPSVGDICCYVPWGNVCIYFSDHGYEDLVKLGKIDGKGAKILASYPSSVKVKFERIK